MMYDYDPGRDYPCIELHHVDLTSAEHNEIQAIIAKAKSDLSPKMGFSQNFDVFFVAPLGFRSMVAQEAGIALAAFCQGTSSRPLVGFDLAELKGVCAAVGVSFTKQFEISLAHELGHAYQEKCGYDDFDEDAAELFGITWADYNAVDLSILEKRF